MSNPSNTARGARGRALTSAALSLVLGVAAAAPAIGQQPLARSGATGINVHSYTMGSGLGASSATLFLLPVAVQLPLNPRLLGEFYTAYGIGRVGLEGRALQIAAPTDTWLRVSYTLAGNAVAALGVNIPTGHPTHDGEEAVVAAVLATDLLGFREASWGMGLAGTAGLSTAYRVQSWDLTLGGSYRMNSDYRPRADTTMRYTPGNEARLRVASSRELGEGRTVMLGLMALNYGRDEVDRRNLFQAGTRVMADASYAFPGRDGTWTVFMADVWRGQGDVIIPVLDQAATLLRDSLSSVGGQNLFMVGGSGEIRVRNVLVRPSTDARIQRGAEPGADGWLVGVSANVPLQLRNLDLFPSARLTAGRIQTAQLEMARVTGIEVSLIARRRFP
jgi:hypothetical protein